MLDVARRRRDVEQHGAQVHHRDPVHHRLVGLGHQGHPVAGQPLHQVELPQGTAAVQLPTLQADHQLVQLGVAAGLGQGAAPDVVGDVEVLVVHPDRVRQPPGDPPDLLPVPRYERDPVVDQGDQPVVTQPADRLLEDEHAAHVHRCGGRFCGEERPVQRT